MFKKLFKSDGFRALLSRLATAYIRLVAATGRWTHVGRGPAEAFWARKEPFIFAFWHGRLLMAPVGWTASGAPVKVMVSQHRDGDLIANTIAPIGVGAIRGSTAKPGRREKGGAAALKAMVRELKSGGCVAVTPDGPRGPAEEVGPGVIQLARLTGAAIIPFAYSATQGRNMSSWDRFLVAFPFARGYYVWGEPHYVPRDADDAAQETARAALETALAHVTEDADRLAGRADK